MEQAAHCTSCRGRGPCSCLPFTLARLEAENDQISIFFSNEMLLLEAAAQASPVIAMSGPQGALVGVGWDGIPGPWCPPCQLVVGQVGPLLIPELAPTSLGALTGPLLPACPAPGLCPHLVVLGPSLPPPEPPVGMMGAPCLTGLWVLGGMKPGVPLSWEPVRSHPALGSQHCARWPPYCGYFYHASHWVSWSFIFL